MAYHTLSWQRAEGGSSFKAFSQHLIEIWNHWFTSCGVEVNCDGGSFSLKPGARESVRDAV